MSLGPMRRHVPRRLTSRALVCVSLSCFALACDDRGAGGREGVAVRDSSGVRVVHNTMADAPWGGASPWRAVPDLAIGSDSAESYRLGQVGDVAVTSTGDIVVIDQSVAQLRVFDRNGAFRRLFSRDGRGPGELSRFSSAVLVGDGDSLFVPDPSDRRITVFAPDGSFGRVIPTTTLPQGKSWLLLDDGRVLQRGSTTSRDAEGAFAFWDAMMRVAADGSAADTLFVFDHAQTPIGGPGKIRIALIVNSPSWARLPDGRIVWSALDRDFLSVHDSTGRVVGRYTRGEWRTRPVTDADKTAMRELLRVKLRALGGDAGAADSPMVEAPPIFPSITAVRAGPGGTIWVQRMGDVASIDPMAINAAERSDFFGGSTWDVLEGDGSYAGSIELPPRFRIFRVTDDAIYGAARDEDGVEQVLRLALRRGG